MRIQAWQIILLIVAFILLFGWKNLPNAARSLGESMRVFKTEVDQMKDENAARKDRAPGEPPLPGAGERTDDTYRDTAAEEYRRLKGRTDDGDPRA